MATLDPTRTRLSGVDAFDGPDASDVVGTASAVSWASILAGAAAAAALSLILLLLGVGLGLSSVSPWARDGVEAGTFGIAAIAWLTFTQLAASGMGGYLAGRLRTRWVAVHTDEVYFRDTAHGFLAWAVATLFTAAALGSAVGGVVSGGASLAGGAAKATALAAGAAGGTAGTAAAIAGAGNAGDLNSPAGDPLGYWTDTLFRSPPLAGDATSAGGGIPTGATAATSGIAAVPGSSGTSSASGAPGTAVPAGQLAEAGRIFAMGLKDGALSAPDQQYLGQLIAQRTGLNQQEAVARANQTFTAMQTKLKQAEVSAREAADKARKASLYAALWLFISLLIGAFVASFTATFGGRQRDL